ncbi:MAG: biosynthetic peptidoglycan transglycosylase, partial [Flavobacteriaceae bacterium]
MPNKRSYRKFVRFIWFTFLGSILFVVAIFSSASLELLGPMPDFRQLENPKTNLATQIISADDTILGKFYFNDNRTPIGYNEIPVDMVNALIATEDERFYAHSGIDFKGTARAVFYLGKKGGASTITQQLARQLFTGVRSSYVLEAICQKIKVWVIAIRLERRYTKKEIITMYLNIYDFNYSADGLRSASSIYF